MLKGAIPWNKGKKLGEEHKKKLSEAHKGQKSWNKGKKGLQVAWNKGISSSIETHRKISEAKKGKLVWNKGKTGIYSSEQIKKMKDSHKGQVAWNKGKTEIYSEETRKKMSLASMGRIAWNKGLVGVTVSGMKDKHHTEEAKRKLSESHKGKPTWMKGKKHAPESLLKMSEAHIGKSAWNKGVPMREETKIKISGDKNPQFGKPSWNRGKRPSEETIKKQIESHRKTLSNPQVMKRISENSRRTLLKLYESGKFPLQTNTKPERQIKEELIKRGYKEGIDFIHQYKFMDKFMCDFCFPQKNIVVEVYGDFWHANPIKYPEGSILHPHQIKGKRVDKSKEAYITKVDNGVWTYISIWESDIRKDVKMCVDRIENALRNKST